MYEYKPSYLFLLASLDGALVLEYPLLLGHLAVVRDVLVHGDIRQLPFGSRNGLGAQWTLGHTGILKTHMYELSVFLA